MKDVKSKWLRAPLMLTALGTALVAASPSQAQLLERKDYPAWADATTRVASAPDTQKVSIALYLGFRNESALKDLIADVSTPGSARFGQYLTADQFRAQFAPDAKSVQLVQSELAKLGFHIDYTPKSGLFVQASGTVAQVKAAFGVSQDLYSYKGKTLRSNAQAPRLPASISGIVATVAGLDDMAMLRQTHHIGLDRPAAVSAAAVEAMAKSPNAPPTPYTSIPSPFCSQYFGERTATLQTGVPPYATTLPWLNCGYTPQQMRLGYGANDVKEDGKGVTVAIVDIYGSPTIVEDANIYSLHHSLPLLTSKNFRQILPAGILTVPASDPCGPQGWYVEESLDVDSVHSMAPGADIVFAGDTCTDPANAPLYSLIDEHTADIITNSYGYDINDNELPSWFIITETFYFEQAAAEGVSVMFSSGDDGDLIAAAGQPLASGSWDATSAYVTAVGGTSLALLNSKGDKHEWGWGTYRVFLNNATVEPNGKSILDSGPALPFAFYAGAGGGPSLIQLAPSYQSGVPYSLAGYTTNAAGAKVALGAAYRVTPDIAMDADPYTGFLFGMTYTMSNPPTADAGCIKLSKTTEYCEVPEGGTSLSSPTFAGVVARVDQARFQKHKSAIGFLNPAMYSIASVETSGSTAPIVDVQAPRSPTAVLRGYVSNLHELRVVTMNSTLNSSGGIVEGADTSYLTTPGYDEVTGLGTPWIPAFIEALSAL
jgi:subtilase family serine protease